MIGELERTFHRHLRHVTLQAVVRLAGATDRCLSFGTVMTLHALPDAQRVLRPQWSMGIVAGNAGHVRFREAFRLRQPHGLEADDPDVFRGDALRRFFFRASMTFRAAVDRFMLADDGPEGVMDLSSRRDMVCAGAMTALTRHAWFDFVLQDPSRIDGQITGMAAKAALRQWLIKQYAQSAVMARILVVGLARRNVKLPLVAIPGPAKLQQIGGTEAVVKRCDPGAGMMARTEAPAQVRAAGDASSCRADRNFTVAGGIDMKALADGGSMIHQPSQQCHGKRICGTEQSAGVASVPEQLRLFVTFDAGAFVSTPIADLETLARDILPATAFDAEQCCQDTEGGAELHPPAAKSKRLERCVVPGIACVHAAITKLSSLSEIRRVPCPQQPVGMRVRAGLTDSHGEAKPVPWHTRGE